MSTLKEYAAGKDWSGFMNRMAPQRVSQVKACKNLDEAVQLLHSWYLDYFGTRENCLALAREIRKKEAVPATVPPPAVQTPAPAAPAVQPVAPATVAPVEAEKPKPEAQIVVAPVAAPEPAELGICSSCGKENPIGACPICGGRVLPQKKEEKAPAASAPAAPAPTAKYCRDCGKQLVPPGTFCGECGAAQQATMPAAAPKPAPKPETKTFRQANGKPPKKGLNIGRILLIVAVVLAFGYVLRDCARGDFWKKLGVVSTPVSVQPSATVVKGSTTPAATATLTRTATVSQTKVSEVSRATEPVDRLVSLRTLAFILAVAALALSVVLLIRRRRVLASLAAALAVVLLLVGGSAWLALIFLSPATPTGTPAPTVVVPMTEATAESVIATATAKAATPTAKSPKVVTAEAILTAEATPTATAAAPTATPTKLSEKATTSTPTKPAPQPSGETKVFIEGFGRDLPGCLTLVFFSQGREVKRLAVISSSMTWNGLADRVKVEGSPDGSCPWSNWTVDQSEKEVRGGEAKFKFSPKINPTPTFDRGRPG